MGIATPHRSSGGQLGVLRPQTVRRTRGRTLRTVRKPATGQDRMDRREIVVEEIVHKRARATRIVAETAVERVTEAVPETEVEQAATAAAPGEAGTGSAIAAFPIRVLEATPWVDQVAAQRARAVRADRRAWEVAVDGREVVAEEGGGDANGQGYSNEIHGMAVLRKEAGVRLCAAVCCHVPVLRHALGAGEINAE